MILSTQDWLLALRDGALLSLIVGGWMVFLLWLNPRLFLRHYPPEVRAATPPTTLRERWLRLSVGIPLLVVLVGGPILSAAALDARHGGAAPTLALFADAFTVGFVFNLVDWLIIDELWIGVFRPRWVMIPGTEDVPYRFDHRYHFRGFIVGTVLVALIALIATAVVRWV